MSAATPLETATMPLKVEAGADPLKNPLTHLPTKVKSCRKGPVAAVGRKWPDLAYFSILQSARQIRSISPLGLLL